MDLDSIARQLARALPAWGDREAVARAVGLRDVQLAGRADTAWRLLLEAADATGKVTELVQTAARRRPRDRTLAALAGFPLPTQRGAFTGRWLALGVLVVVGLIARWSMTPESEPTTDADDAGKPVVASVPNPAAPATANLADLEAEAARDPLRAAAEEARAGQPGATAEGVLVPTTPTPSPTSTPPAAAPSGAPARGEEQPPPVAVMAELAAVPRAEAERASTQEPARAASAGRGPCQGRNGFAFVAPNLAPSAGATWVLPGAVNVRSDYPRADNGWNKSAPVVCVLTAGSRVFVGSKPVPVPGGGVWVPIKGDAVGRD
jgi:hypothetical protein